MLLLLLLLSSKLSSLLLLLAAGRPGLHVVAGRRQGQNVSLPGSLRKLRNDKHMVGGTTCLTPLV